MLEVEGRGRAEYWWDRPEAEAEAVGRQVNFIWAEAEAEADGPNP